LVQGFRLWGIETLRSSFDRNLQIDQKIPQPIERKSKENLKMLPNEISYYFNLYLQTKIRLVGAVIKVEIKVDNV